MKKIFLLVTVCACFGILNAGAQSLADIAKQSKAQQKSNPNAKVIDNDVIPSVMEAEPAPAAKPDDKKDDAAAAKSDVKKDDVKDDVKKDDVKKDDAAATKKEGGKDEKDAEAEKKEATEKLAAEEQNKKDDLKKQINAQMSEIKQLQRELNVAQREAGLRAAAYYADAGVMLRDQTKYAEDSRNLQTEIDSKQQSLAQAKQKLEGLQEQARKSGISSSELE